MANGAPSENPPSLAHTSGYATDCGGRHFTTRPRAALSHVWSLLMVHAGTSHKKNQKQKNLITFCSKPRPFTEMQSRKTAQLTSKKKWHFRKQLKNELKCLEN